MIINGAFIMMHQCLRFKILVIWKLYRSKISFYNSYFRKFIYDTPYMLIYKKVIADAELTDMKEEVPIAQHLKEFIEKDNLKYAEEEK